MVWRLGSLCLLLLRYLSRYLLVRHRDILKLHLLHGLSYNTTFANGNLFANIPASNTYGKAFGDIVIKSGKWYWEVYYNQAGGNGNYLYVGLGDMVKGDDFIRAVRGSDGEKIPNTGGTEVRFATGDIINVAVDMDNGKWYIGRNGTYWYSGNPVAGTGFVHNLSLIHI